jgi:hypothetical protein
MTPRASSSHCSGPPFGLFSPKHDLFSYSFPHTKMSSPNDHHVHSISVICRIQDVPLHESRNLLHYRRDDSHLIFNGDTKISQHDHIHLALAVALIWGAVVWLSSMVEGGQGCYR